MEKTTVRSGTPAARASRYALLLAWPLNQLGGVNNVIRNLIREFEEAQGPEPVMIEMAYHAERPQPVRSAFPYWKVKALVPYDERHPWRTLASFCFQLPVWLWRASALVRSQNIRTINPHFAGFEHFGFSIMRRLRIFRGRLILSFHGADIRGMLQTRGLERWLYRLMLQSADILAPCSLGLMEEILMFAPECAERTFPVQNGIDIDRFLSTADPDFQLPENAAGRKVILNIGAFEYKKDHDTLLQAFRLVKEKHPGVALIIAGQRASLLDHTRQLVSGLGLAGDVTLLVDLPHARIAALLKKIDLFVLSSRWRKGICGEGLAMALLEAGAASKPVVSTASCGVSELIAGGETGLLVPPESPEALADAIDWMLINPAGAQRMAADLHRRVQDRFTWKRAYLQYVALASGQLPSAETAAGQSEPRGAHR